MADKVDVRLSSDQMNSLQAMQDEGLADNRSDAIRTALDRGFVQLGYRNGQKRDTRLRLVTRRLADAFALLGVMWIGLSFWLPIEYRAYAVAPLLASVTCLTIDRVLQSHEPAISRRLATVLGGESA